MAISSTTVQPSVVSVQSWSQNQNSSTIEPISHAQQKANLNAAIIQSNQVALGVKNQPLALLLTTAIENLNERLAPELGENAIQKVADSGIDFSPEATAERIVSLSTQFYEAFKVQHKGENEAGVLNKFMDVIGGGIEKGFSEAREILEGLAVLQGGIASNIDQTYDLVQQGLQAFREQYSKPEEAST